jgi:pimeloyl-ACP methyl ester carboxylesterase
MRCVGRGEPVVLIHNGAGIDWFTLLFEQPALAGRYRLVSYDRVGYGGSSRSTGPMSFPEEASHTLTLLRHLSIGRAHVVGHSSSAMIALQLALDRPDSVQTCRCSSRLGRRRRRRRSWTSSGRSWRPPCSVRGPATKAGAVDTWMRGVCGPDDRASLERMLPDALDRAVADADTYFGQEVPAVQQWSFTEADAARVSQPVLAVLGTRSNPVFRERRDLLLGWLPHAEPFDLAGATHLLHVEMPEAMAEGLAAFFAGHPCS